MHEEDIKQKAEEFARANRQNIAKEFTDKQRYLSDSNPISVFMAGSPGAGKTEFSKQLIGDLEKYNERKVIRIDGDELRKLLPGYTGDNSYLFQTAVSLIVERIHDMVLDNNQTFLLDGTFSNYDKAVNNIKRSLSRNRLVYIFYVYQKPDVAWKFTEAREVLEGRNIPKEVFIQQFINTRKVIKNIQAYFGEKVSIVLVKKNFETHTVEDVIDIRDGKKIDDYLDQSYTEDELKKLL